MYYCDTDSLITTAKYPTSGKIGELKEEGRWKEGIFLSPKTYALRSGKKEMVKFKGFDADNFSFSVMKKALLKRTVLTEKRTRILGWKEAVKRKNDILRKTGKFLILVNTEKSTSFDIENRLTFKDEKHIFNTCPHIQAGAVSP
jgi:hypothetical protein